VPRASRDYGFDECDIGEAVDCGPWECADALTVADDITKDTKDKPGSTVAQISPEQQAVETTSWPASSIHLLLLPTHGCAN